MLQYEETGNVRPFSGGDVNDPTITNNRTTDRNTSESSSSSNLRDQILELNDRMKYLEVRLLRRRDRPSSPTLPYDEENDINRESEAREHYPSPRSSHRHHRHGRPEGRGRGAAAESAPTTRITAPAVAGQLFVPGIGHIRGGGRGGFKQGSQDDLAYHSPERIEEASSLSKKSWPPSTRSSTAAAAAASIGVVVHGGSIRSGGSSSNSSSTCGDPFHASAGGKEVTGTSPHLHRWEGRGNAGGARVVVAAGGRRNSGGRVREVERAGSSARRGKSGGRSRSGNPPGIVLI